MTEEPVKVALWCIPRSMSTVLTKCISAIDGTEVFLELFSYAALASGTLKTKTGHELPKTLKGNEADYEEAIASLREITNITLIPRRISCHDIQKDLENTKSKYVFMKEMSYIIDATQEYLPRGFKYVFLTRDPSRVFASYRKGRQTSGIFGQGEFDIVIDDPAELRPLLWFEKQHQLWKHVQKNLDPKPVIIDAFDLCSQPKKILKGFCDAVGFPFSDSLLQWSPSTEFPKNFVTAGAGDDLFENLSAFYDRAFSSTHFMKPTESGPIPRDQLPDDVIRCIDYSMPFYSEMYENRLLPS